MASLAAVVGGTAEGVYQDPTAFFANTFPTAGLKSLLAEAFGRIAGRPPHLLSGWRQPPNSA